MGIRISAGRGTGNYARHPRHLWGEQAIRPAVVTKVWGGNRTGKGAVTQQRIASVLRTCHQQRVDPYTIIEEVLRSPVARVASLPSLASGP